MRRCIAALGGTLTPKAQSLLCVRRRFVLTFSSTFLLALSGMACAADAPPTIATPAQANPANVVGTSTTLTVLGSDDGGEPGLKYLWSVAGAPASPPTFSVNNSNAAKTTKATFHASGTFTFIVTVTDASNQSVTSSVDVVVTQTLKSVTISPASVAVNPGGSQQFTGTAKDQFGKALTPQPVLSWNVSAGGAIDNTGLFIADPGFNGSATVTATTGGTSGTASVKANTAPTVVTSAAVDANPVLGTTGLLSVLGDDDAGESKLVYSWSTTGTPPAVVTFAPNNSNAAKNATATFKQAGSYSLQVTIKDAQGLTVTSAIDVTVQQTATSIVVTPASATVNPGSTFQFTATVKDQFKVPLAVQPVVLWSADQGGSIDNSGLYTAGANSGQFTILAASGNANITSNVTINAAPTVATAATIDVNPVFGTTANLSVLGADDGPESALKYTWSAVGNPPANVSFAPNGNNAAKTSVATFHKAGDYTLQATIKDAFGLIATSTVSVTVVQTSTSLLVTPQNATVKTNGTKQFTAKARDQFNVLMVVQPEIFWFNADVSLGYLDGGGLFHAGPTPGGPIMVFAGADGLNGLWPANVTVDAAPTIAITSPANGSSFQSPATLSIQTNAMDMDGSVSRVDLFQNNVKISTTNVAPFSFTVNGLLPGTYSFKATAVDNANLSTSSTIVRVTVFDRIAPVIQTPNNVIAEATDANGAIVSYPAATATDETTPNPAVTYSQNSGTQFPLGVTIVGVTATDGANNSSTASFTVTVRDSTPPAIVQPADITSAATSPNGAVVTFPALIVTDAVTAAPQFSFAPPSGSVFPIGATQVTATATDAAGNSSTATFQVNIIDVPTVSVAASANPNPVSGTGPVLGRTTALSVVGADVLGENTLTYTWSAMANAPAPVAFSANGNNAAKNSNATFTKAGTYELLATITNGSGRFIMSSVQVVVAQTPTTISIAPQVASLNLNGMQQFTATASDQFGNALTSQPDFTWTVTGGGQIDAHGKFIANSNPGTYTVTAAAGASSNTATVNVLNAAPTIVTAAAATPNPDTFAAAVVLSALGADDGGEGALTYTWQVVGTPPSPVTFTPNGTNEAKKTLAAFTQSGAYTVQVTATDAFGLIATSTVTFSADLSTGILVSAPALTLTPGGDASLSVWLAGGPANDVIVSIALPPNVAIVDSPDKLNPLQLTFKTTAFSTPQTIKLASTNNTNTSNVVGNLTLTAAGFNRVDVALTSTPALINDTSLVRTTPFDANGFANDEKYRTNYLATVDPSRVWQSAEPAAGVPIIRADGSRRIVTGSYASFFVAVITAPNAPVTFYSTGKATFDASKTNSVTVRADAQGHASATMNAPKAGKSGVLASSPMSSGLIRFEVQTNE